MRGTEKIIDLAAIRSNYLLLNELAPNSQTLAVIKADAYGHSAEKVAHCLTGVAPAFAVAFLDEAMSLRKCGITTPILLLEGAMSREETRVASAHGFWLMVHAEHQVQWLLDSPYPKDAPVWIKLDTGMGRLGFAESELAKNIKPLKKHGHDRLILCSHCACADDPLSATTLAQVAQLKRLANQHCLPFSLANSAGIIHWPETHGHWNRLGVAMYGIGPSNDKHFAPPIHLQPAMSLQSKVLSLRIARKGSFVGYGETWQAERDSVIATVAIGYADGYPRHAPSGTPVVINGQRAPLAGLVSMDMITVDVTDVSDVSIGSVVQLWGDKLCVSEVAAFAGTISYELLTRVSPRVKNSYIS